MFRKRSPDRDSRARRPWSLGFTLVELLIVVAILGIFATLALSRIEPTFHDQLQAAAEIVVADLNYVRSLSVANNSRYRFTFDPQNRRYSYEHSGTNPLLNVLPASPFGGSATPSTRHTTDFSTLSAFGAGIEIVAVRKVSTGSQRDATTVEFGPLGSLIQAEDCWIWLAVGSGDSRRYLPVELDAITGLASVGTLQSSGPPALSVAVASSQTAGPALGLGG